MARILRGLDIPYLQILQPNQYLSKKPFTEQERAIALAWDKWYAQPTHDGYLLLAAAGESLIKDGDDFVSALEIYDNVTEPLYADDCCHTNREGEVLLARFIAAHLPAMP
jgi:hypothetical protein